MTTKSFPVYCPICHETTNVTVSIAGYRAWLNGALIQKAMPELTAAERERLISGICPKCWDTIVKGDTKEYFGSFISPPP